jgi:mannose-6-phosphate isomerase
MLTYNHGPAEKQLCIPERFCKHSLLYNPPIDEFTVIKTELGNGMIEKMPGLNGPSLLLVTQGSGALCDSINVKMGDVYFIGADMEVTLKGTSESNLFYRAFCAI